MPVCQTNIQPIFDNECLGESLLKINNNFLNLQEAVCELKTRIDSQVEVRTFFYYGPNAQTNPGSGMADDQTSRPSDITIQAFVNSPTQLNLPSISKQGDVAYVIYQKTGYLNSLTQGTNINASPTPSNTVTLDVFNSFAPTFIIWRLTCQSSQFYTVDIGFPKFSRAQQSASGDVSTWNNPQNWSTF